MYKLLVRLSVKTIAFITLLVMPFPVMAELDITSWNKLLTNAVSNGEVDYTQWQNNPRFDTLVEQIGTSQTQDMSLHQKLAFYINAYNILAAQGILSGRSPGSFIGRYTYFKRDKYLVAGERISLHTLEHDLIRPLGEPRIHFAIVCASQSCPILQSSAFTPQYLDQQLQAAAIGFINNPKLNQFDTAARRAELSSIFKWFEEDFVASGGSLQDYLAPLVNNEKIANLLRQNAFEISYLNYDWNLNGTL